MKNVRLEAPAETREEDTAPDAPSITRLAEALREDAAGDPEDERLAALLLPDGASDGKNGGRAEALFGPAERIESGNGGYPNLTRTAAALASGPAGDERERAVHASEAIVRPLAQREAIADRTG